MAKTVIMIKAIILLTGAVTVISCAPVLNKDLMSRGMLTASLSGIKNSPSANKGKIFIIGGIIVKTSPTREGSLIEAIFVPVTARGYLKSYQPSEGRFLAIYRGKELLDPLIYSEKREITLAGEFVEMRKGQIGEMEYAYPLFEIREIHLWEEVRERDHYYYMPPPYYYPWYYRSRFYDPWWYYY